MLFGVVSDGDGQDCAVVDVDGVAWVDLRDGFHVEGALLGVAWQVGRGRACLVVVSEQGYRALVLGAVYEAVVKQEAGGGGCEDIPAVVQADGLVGGAYAC